MGKKRLIMGILGLALILAVMFVGCGWLVNNNAEPDPIPPPLIPVANAFITLDSNTKYQYVRGFGGMDVPWLDGGWQLIKISPDEYNKMYDPDGPLGLNIMRIMIMPINAFHGGEVPDSKYTFTTIPEEFLTFITGNSYRPNYVEGVKIVNNHGGYVLASPWTPPPEWKTNNSIVGRTGESLETAHYQDYANYLKAFAQAMYDRNAPIYAISIQNEPNYGTDGTQIGDKYEGCIWLDNQMRDFFLQVGNFTNGVAGWGKGTATGRVLIMNGESANTPAIHAPTMNNETTRNIVDLLARHNYGQLGATPYNPGKDYGKEMWMTEMNINSGSASKYPDDSTWNYVWSFLNDVDLTIRGRSDNAYIGWSLKRFYSFIGDGQYGTTDGEILPRGYAISHYAQFAKEKHRIGVTRSGTLKDGTLLNDSNFNNPTINRESNSVRVTAFISESGKELSVVMYTPTNTNGEYGYDLGAVQINLPEGFVAASAAAIKSNAAAQAQPEVVFLDPAGTSAIVTLSRSEILSVKFTQQSD
jgi:O-glycosyl hydrolase